MGVYLKKSKSAYNGDTCTPMFTAARFTTEKSWHQGRCPSTGEWIKTKCCMYTMEYN
jgi:hypothetical protein